jgi:hypothetical protein
LIGAVKYPETASTSQRRKHKKFDTHKVTSFPTGPPLQASVCTPYLQGGPGSKRGYLRPRA